MEVPDRDAWRRWLERHHDRSQGVWLTIRKRRADGPGVAYQDAVEEALCFGWIDSRMRPVDERTYLLTMTPRRPGGIWAASNKERVARLTAAGRMAPAGLAVVEAAKADGSWDVLTDAEALVVPEDLEAALAASAGARFDALPPSMRTQLLYWIASAKRPETRAKRIEATVRDSAANVRRIAP